MQYFSSSPEPSPDPSFARLFFEGSYTISAGDFGNFLVELAESESERRADYCESFIRSFSEAVAGLPEQDREHYLGKFVDSVNARFSDLIKSDSDFATGVIISLGRALEACAVFSQASSLYTGLSRNLMRELAELPEPESELRDALVKQATVVASLGLRAAFYDGNYELVDRIHEGVLRSHFDLDSFQPNLAVYVRHAQSLKALGSNQFDVALRSSRENLFAYQELAEAALPDLELELRLLFARCLHCAGETSFAIKRYREAVEFSFEHFGADSEQSYLAHVELYDFHRSIADFPFATGLANRLLERSKDLFEPDHVESKLAWGRVVSGLIEQGEFEKANSQLQSLGHWSLIGSREHARELQSLYAALDIQAENYERAERRILSLMPGGVVGASDHWEDWQRPYVTQLVQCRARGGKSEAALELASALRDHYAVQGLKPDGDYFHTAFFAAEAADQVVGGLSGQRIVREALEADRRANKQFPMHHVRLLIKSGELYRRGAQPNHDKALERFERAGRVISELGFEHCPEYRRILGHLIELSSAVGNNKDFIRYQEKLELVEILSAED